MNSIACVYVLEEQSNAAKMTAQEYLRAWRKIDIANYLVSQSLTLNIRRSL